MSYQRRITDQTPSGGMIPTAAAAKLLDLTPNGFRDVVNRGLIKPAYTFRNGPQPLRVFWRHEVESLRDRRIRREQGIEALDRELGFRSATGGEQ